MKQKHLQRLKELCLQQVERDLDFRRNAPVPVHGYLSYTHTPNNILFTSDVETVVYGIDQNTLPYLHTAYGLFEVLYSHGARMPFNCPSELEALVKNCRQICPKNRDDKGLYLFVWWCRCFFDIAVADAVGFYHKIMFNFIDEEDIQDYAYRVESEDPFELSTETVGKTVHEAVNRPSLHLVKPKAKF